MFKRVTPIAVCGFILFLALKSVFTDHNVVEAKAIKSISKNSLADYQYNKIDDISECRNKELAVYFHDIYMTYHSSEIINEALATSKDCDIKTINVVIYDVDYKDTPIEQVEDELEAYIEHHELTTYANYEIVQAEMDTLSLNGRFAKLSFEFDNNRNDMKTASYNGSVN